MLKIIEEIFPDVGDADSQEVLAYHAVKLTEEDL
jgi:hypothetical protein